MVSFLATQNLNLAREKSNHLQNHSIVETDRGKGQGEQGMEDEGTRELLTAPTGNPMEKGEEDTGVRGDM